MILITGVLYFAGHCALMWDDIDNINGKKTNLLAVKSAFLIVQVTRGILENKEAEEDIGILLDDMKNKEVSGFVMWL